MAKRNETGYQYRELTGSQSNFRLLILKPGEWDSEIFCELQHEALLLARPYEALSYVWGDPHIVKSIRLDGYLHYVTYNLYAALQNLRYENRERVLWVDALCINQQDLKEGSQQVQLMSSIYNKANMVFSWLGESSHDSDEAMQLIGDLGQWSRQHGELILEELETEDLTASELFDRMGFPLASRNWAAFWELLNRPYWTRVWIIQELAASGTFERARGTLFCGSASVERRLFDYTCATMLAIIMLGKNLQTGGRVMEEPMRSMLIKGHPPGLSMAQMLSACAKGKPAALEWLLKLSSRFEATEVRDKIYSLLGLVCNEHRAFTPDYAKPLDLVLQDLVRFLIRTSGNLDILLGNRFNMNPYGPSWTPILSRQFHNDTVLATEESAFAAAAGRPPSVSFEPGSGVMKAKGLIAGRIKCVIGPWNHATQVPADAEGVRAASERLGHQKFLEDLATFSRTLDEPDEEDFWRTLVMDRNADGLENTTPAPEEFRDMYRVFIGKQSVPADFLPGAPAWVRVGEFSQPYHTSLGHTIANRCFFATECGRMGLGPYCTRAGDIGVVLLGSPICLVLREAGSSYKLIGDAYVHGIMSGELVKGRAEEEFQNFVLS